MLRLVYHTDLFGALYLEYNQPLVRVGSSSDNDLVLLHPSVSPHHCSLLFEEDSVRVLPADFQLRPEGLPPGLEVPCYVEGDTLPIGEVPLLVEHSPNTVALPCPRAETVDTGLTPDGYWRADAGQAPPRARWLCRACAIRLEDRQITRIGLEKSRKHFLCPKCSHELELIRPQAAEETGLLAAIRSLKRRGLRWLGIRPRRR